MHLNVSALSDPNSLCILLVSSLVCAPDPILIQTLVDSGSTHCFLDSAFACEYSLPTTPTFLWNCTCLMEPQIILSLR